MGGLETEFGKTMKWSFLPLALLALGASVHAEQPTKRVNGQISNAERLARGLPLLPPRRRTGPLLPRQSNSPPITVYKECSIEATRAEDGSFYGYIGILYSEGAEGAYGWFTDSPSPPDGLNISFMYSYDPSGSQTTFTGLQARTQNSMNQESFGYLGVVGVQTITAESGYGFLTDVTQYANSPSVNSANAYSGYAESGNPAEGYVWTFDSSTYDLELSWTAADGSSIALQVGMDEQGKKLYLSPSLSAIETEFDVSLVPLHFQCLEIYF
uniref:Uncharacterized protein n=1 Tax=Mycena chlorophos TaxID=658473 RepID=A0ABQ0LI53_MYCCL|nr:predicted protein [Mycena chlorophos]